MGAKYILLDRRSGVVAATQAIVDLDGNRKFQSAQTVNLHMSKIHSGASDGT